MSLWYYCTFAAIGTDAENLKLKAACNNYWHHAKVENQLSPGFVQVQVSRNYGAHDAIEKMVTDFPGVVFIGSLHVEQNFGNNYIDNNGDVDRCQWWRFHGVKGLVEWGEMPASPKLEVEPFGSTKTRVMSEQERENFREIRQAGLHLSKPSRDALWEKPQTPARPLHGLKELYLLLTNLRADDRSDVFNHLSVTPFVSFEKAASKLYDWYNGQTGDDGEIYHSEWRVDKDGHRWFNPHFPECEIRQIYFYTSND